MPKLDVHPLAAIFPMMADDELAELAADIKANGQRFPIIIGKHENKEVIVDGRNRLRACEIADVEPKFAPLNGQDATAFILSANINRRHLSAGQRAMAAAIIYPEPQQTHTGKKSVLSETKSTLGFSAARLSQARAVLRHSRPLAEAVLEGTPSLDAAYAKVQQEQGNANKDVARLRRLRDTRPDLADQVVQGDMKLEDAEKKASADAEQVKSRRWAASKNLIEAVQILDRDLDVAQAFADDFDPAIAAQSGEEITATRINRAAAFLTAVGEALSKREEAK